MQDTTRTPELFGQLAGKTIDTLTVWAETNQRILRELVDLGASAAREGVRAYVQLHAGAEQAGRSIQESLAGAAARLRDIYTAS
jgi:hypothetical protein